jgi:hypothetical protein
MPPDDTNREIVNNVLARAAKWHRQHRIPVDDPRTAIIP